MNFQYSIDADVQRCGNALFIQTKQAESYLLWMLGAYLYRKVFNSKVEEEVSKKKT